MPRPVLVAFLLATLVAPSGASPGERGHPLVQFNPPGQARIDFFSIAVTRDPAGCVYLGGPGGVRYYDGVGAWQLIKLPTESAGVRRFARAPDGTIYVAGAGVIGFLRGWGPEAVFVSLADRLPPSELGAAELHDVLAVGDAVYFADEEKILIWRGGRFVAIPYRTPARSRGARLHGVGDTAFVTAPGHGLGRVVRERIEPVADDPIFRENQIVLLERGRSGELVWLTARRGFFQLTAGPVAPLAAEANRRLAGKTVWRALRLTGGELAVAFDAPSGDGGMRFDSAGRYVGPIDQSIGLSVATVRDFSQDHEGGLWLGTESGACRVEWPSAISIFNVINGLGSGAVADFTRHEGVMWVATAEGVYRMVPPNDETGRGASFRRIFSRPAYGVLSHSDGLLAAGYDRVYLHTAAGFVPIAAGSAGGGRLLRSKSDPARVWIVGAGESRSIRRTAEGWREEPAGSAPASDVAPVEAVAWRADAAGIWQVPRDGSPPRKLPRLTNELAGAAVAKLWEEPGRDGDGPVLWIGASDGLLRLEIDRAFPVPIPFATQLAATGVKSGDRLAPKHGELKFSYVGHRHQLRRAVTYQSRLVGFDPDWSEWSAKNERTFANLPSARYRFEARARDLDGQLGAPAVLAFSVLPPWWLTWWMLLGYAAAGAGAIAGVVRWRTRALRDKAAQLEQTVALRTAELAQRNVELVRLHQLELDEKISARLGEEKARLEVLRYQLNPHFLFNTLASISASLPAGGSAARSMVERLAEFCRLTLHRAGEEDWTTLGEELRLLRAYLEIEQSRWGDLLDVDLACHPTLDGERVPHFLLLPLVENALKYGRATSPDRVGLRLAARRDGDGAVVLEVANTGEWVEPAAPKTVSSFGIGLDNLRERLARHYPRAHRMEIAHASGWVTVTLRLTAHREETRDGRRGMGDR
ncbi:MAG: histidine kinase [Verrucomicrobia bacterium]|nr:histidine kinase [Verrucomicrobiota bacterium]